MSKLAAPSDVTRLLHASRDDDRAQGQLLQLVYEELHRRAQGMMSGERAGHTLQATALVHETYFRLVNQADVTWQGRAHFYAIASQIMRRILVDHARRRRRRKRGGDVVKVALDEDRALSTPRSTFGSVSSSVPSSVPLSVERGDDVLVIDDCLKRLQELDPRQAKIVELRFFVGLTVEEVAEVLHISKRTVESEWTMAKAWLRRELT